MAHPLDSARERLKRADENIRNLNAEITEFLASVPVVRFTSQQGEDPVFSQNDREAFDALKKFIASGTVEPRFRVLAGEIVHHLRSAFDHLAWQLSSPEARLRYPTRIGFPISKELSLCGISKTKMSGYCRKIEGIDSPTALARIDSLQPYKRIDSLRHPLWLIHDMDRIDKHRELVLTTYIMRADISGVATVNAIGEHRPYELRPRRVTFVGSPQVEVRGEMSAQITFGELREREDEPIIPTLKNLLSFAGDAVESFAGEFF